VLRKTFSPQINSLSKHIVPPITASSKQLLSLEDKMKNLIIAAVALVSVSSFAGETERDMVKVSASSAQSAYAQAQDMAATIKAAIRSPKLSMLNKCNYTGSDAQDRSFFRRNTWVNSSQVSVNHVTGMYTAIVNVSCKQ
jgi:hypothetical protein